MELPDGGRPWQGETDSAWLAVDLPMANGMLLWPDIPLEATVASADLVLPGRPRRMRPRDQEIVTQEIVTREYGRSHVSRCLHYHVEIRETFMGRVAGSEASAPKTIEVFSPLGPEALISLPNMLVVCRS